MSDPRAAEKVQHVALLEDVPGKPAVLAQVEPVVVARHDAGRVLAPVLQDHQGVVDRLIDGVPADDSDYPTHGFTSWRPGGARSAGSVADLGGNVRREKAAYPQGNLLKLRQ